MAAEKGTAQQTAPLPFTEEHVKLAREGKSRQAFEEVLARTARPKAPAKGKASRGKKQSAT
jgi:hypothetical protein